MARDVLTDRTARERGLFEPGEVAKLLGSVDRGYTAPDRVWTLFILEMWFREIADRPPRA